VELRSADWFSRVGVVDLEQVAILSSWGEAIESCQSPQWEYLCLEAANQYRERLLETAPAAFSRWNDTVIAVKPVTEPLVREKAAAVAEQFSLPKVFLDTVEWDILHLCMEAEFSDFVKPGWYASQSYYYANGHFPCGWEGEFPHGRLVVY
jgi:hypothetical protein